MKTLKNAFAVFTAVIAAVFFVAPAFAQEPVASPAAPAAGQGHDSEMMAKMMELAKLSEGHKTLAELAGTWDYTVKMWMDGNTSAEPMTSKGIATRKALMDGRYYEFHADGDMEMPGADGKMQKMKFHGMGIEGYDNAKQKYVSTWMDNMGTGIMMAEGTYDPATKTYNYTSEVEMMPGMKMKVRETVKVVDKDHHTFEWFEDRGGKEMKTMEIAYTRKK